MASSVHSEQELKYVLTDAQHALLRTAEQFANVSAWTTDRLCSRYYDTPDFRLRANHVALRLRLQNDSNFYLTCKCRGTQQGALHQRTEEEISVILSSADVFWPDLPNRLPWEKLELYPYIASIQQGQPYQELFVTDFTREHALLPWQGSVLDMAFDSGFIQAGECSQALHELEVELHSGQVTDLLAFDSLMRQSYGLQPESQSKYQHGLALIEQSTGR